MAALRRDFRGDTAQGVMVRVSVIAIRGHDRDGLRRPSGHSCAEGFRDALRVGRKLPIGKFQEPPRGIRSQSGHCRVELREPDSGKLFRRRGLRVRMRRLAGSAQQNLHRSPGGMELGEETACAQSFIVRVGGEYNKGHARELVCAQWQLR